MLAYGKCPGCGLRMGLRREPTGQRYVCRRCRSVFVHEKRDERARESLLRLLPGERDDGTLMSLPRV